MVGPVSVLPYKHLDTKSGKMPKGLISKHVDMWFIVEEKKRPVGLLHLHTTLTIDSERWSFTVNQGGVIGHAEDADSFMMQMDTLTQAHFFFWTSSSAENWVLFQWCKMSFTCKVYNTARPSAVKMVVVLKF